jgi:phage regulator Rha-like protein
MKMKNELMLVERKEQAVVSSRVVAEIFEKRHVEVISAIEGRKCSCEGIGCKKCSGRGYQQLGLLQGVCEESHTPLKSYFVKHFFKNEQNGQSYLEYLLTRDGFSLLAMGFTGERALAWKVKYIEAFNRMEAFIRERKSSEWLMTRKQGVLIRRSETDTIANLIELAEHQGSQQMRKTAYTIYSKLVNGLVGIEAGQRDKVPFKTLMVITMLEDMILHTIDEEIQAGTHYKLIYKKCKDNGEQMMRFAYLPKLTA